MSSPERAKPGASFAEQATALAWGAWVELGVSGWGQTHPDWAVDPEPLMVFTAALGDVDPRLRDEVTDWCIRYWRFISRVRLKNLLRRQPDDVQAAFGEFAATVGKHAGVTWPGATKERRYKVTGRSTLPPLDRPSLAWLRLRSVFGLGAKTEILRYFLSGNDRQATAAYLAEVTGYGKRNVADECETLERAGVLGVRIEANRFSYALVRGQELASFIGPLPPIRPNWIALLGVARHFVAMEAEVRDASRRTVPVAVRRVLDDADEDFRAMGITLPSASFSGEHLWRVVQALGHVSLGAWSTGRWHERGGRPRG